MSSMSSNDKRVALVTGANRGLGRETARQLGRLGFRVVVTARDAGEAERTADELRSEGLDATGVRLDVTAAETIAAAALAVREQFGRLDVLVNNAGISGKGGYTTPLVEVDPADVQKTFETNTLGPLRVTQAMLPLLARSDAARIVNVSSGMGQLSDMGKGAVSYRISKVALNAVTRLTALELATNGTAKVNAVCPGWVRTDMGGPNAHRSVEDGARGIVWAATLGADGPTGGYFRDGEKLDW